MTMSPPRKTYPAHRDRSISSKYRQIFAADDGRLDEREHIYCKKEIVISTSHLLPEFHMSKHLYAITFSRKPNHTLPICITRSSQEWLLVCITNARLLACDMDG